MARGRFLSRSVSVSEQVDELIDREGYEAGLVITWMIPHLDIEGRMKGNPRSVKGIVCPLRNDITAEKMVSILETADRIGLIKWYQSGNQECVWFPEFPEHQKNLRKDREAKSRIPEHLPEYSRPTPGVLPADSWRTPAEAKSSQAKVRQDKSRTPSVDVKNSDQRSLAVRPATPDRSDPVEMNPDRIFPKNETDVRAVFDHYRKYHPRSHKKPKSTSKEWRNIKARLIEGYSLDDLRQAIDGCHKTPHNLGQNERNQAYLGLELIMRTGDQVVRFIENDVRHQNDPLMGLSEKTRRSVSAGQQWLEEKRNARK